MSGIQFLISARCLWLIADLYPVTVDSVALRQMPNLLAYERRSLTGATKCARNMSSELRPTGNSRWHSKHLSNPVSMPRRRQR